MNWALQLVVYPDILDRKATTALEHSCGQQWRFLRENLEWEHLGNHLLENLIALMFMVTVFNGAADPELETLFLTQLREQILPHGTHEERSTLYQQTLRRRLGELHLVLAAALSPCADAVGDAVRRMTDALAAVAHPDGVCVQAGDAHQGVKTAHPSAGPGLREIDGVYTLRSNDGRSLLVFDAAPITADHLGAHAHADLLNFELSLSGRRVVVNGGSAVYAAGSMRDRQRSALEHSGVRIDGMSCAEPWKSFRLARRGHPLHVNARVNGGRAAMQASQDSFHSIGVRHRRTIVAAMDLGMIQLRDTMLGRRGGIHCLEARLPLAEGIVPEIKGPHVHLTFEGVPIAVIWIESPLQGVRVRCEKGWLSEDFGRPRRRWIVVLTAQLGVPGQLVYRIERIDDGGA